MKEVESPGDILTDSFLIPFEMSVQDLADKSGLSVDSIQRLLYEEEIVDENIAKALAEAVNTTPEFWIGAQKSRTDFRRKQHKKEVYEYFIENHSPINLDEFCLDIYFPNEDIDEYYLGLMSELVAEKKLIPIKIYIPKTKETVEYLFPAGSKVLSEDEVVIKDIIE